MQKPNQTHLYIDGDFYERRKSVSPNFSGEAKNLITSLEKYVKVEI
jgi:hypothetical protein